VHDRNISLLGDCYSDIPGSFFFFPTWHDFRNTSGKALLELLGELPPEDPITLLSRQYWLPSDDSTQHTYVMIEIMGFTDEDFPLLNYRTLSTNNLGRVFCSQIMLSPDAYTLLGGASRFSSLPIKVLGSTPSRVYLDPPVAGGQLRQIGFISAPTTYQLPNDSEAPRSWLQPELLLALLQLGPSTIFTDGSWSPTGPSHSHVTGNSPTFHGTAGIAIISDLPNWKVLPIIVLHVDNGQELGSISAYSMEILGILCGLGCCKFSQPD